MEVEYCDDDSTCTKTIPPGCKIKKLDNDSQNTGISKDNGSKKVHHF